MKLSLFHVVSLLNHLFKTSFTCRIGEIEECKCISQETFLSMICSNKSQSLRDLDFSDLNLTMTRLEQFLDISITKKLFTRIKSTRENNLTFHLQNLQIQNTQLKRIDANSFRHLYNMEKLDLNTNQIETIETNSFQYCFNLKYLDMNFNRLVSITNKTFAYLDNLVLLSLRNNLIEYIEQWSFQSCSNLKFLILDSNKLVRIEPFTLSGLELNLIFLQLNENKIVQIEKYSFIYLNALEKLYLYSNKISLIQNETFGSNLKQLFLQGNQIEEIDTNSFSISINLEILYLYRNKLKAITIDTFSNLVCLQQLWLQQNEITQIDSRSFFHMQSLAFLRLDMNKIKKIEENTFQMLKNLTLLRLDTNELVQIESKTFLNLFNLNDIKLNDNRIEILKNGTFSHLKELENLYLSNNHLNIIEANTFVNLTSLKLLDLSYNYLDESGSVLNGLEENNELVLNMEHCFMKGLENFQFSPKEINLNSNVMKRTDTNGSFRNVVSLKLESNSLTSLKRAHELINLKSLYLSRNSFVSFESITRIKHLEFLDMSYNLIERINEFDLNSLSNLKWLNLSFNRIRFIHGLAFVNLFKLESFRFAQNLLDKFNANILFNQSDTLLDLDLSSNRIEFNKYDNRVLFGKLKVLNLENGFTQMFLNEHLIELNLSQNNLSGNFYLLNNLTRIEKLYLKNVNLISMDELKCLEFQNVSFLDLSHNKLTRVEMRKFFNLKSLDLSFNQIEFINFDDLTIDHQLEYLNLASNRLRSLGTFCNFIHLHELIVSDNFLDEIPNFELKLTGDFFIEIGMFLFDHNKLTRVSYLPFAIETISWLSFDFNQIEFIEINAFENLRSLQNLSISNNLLKNVTISMFYFQFELIFLNLSFNLIEFIELQSFQNLNELKSLDLSYNRLKSIEKNSFFGLINLNHLYLMNNFTFGIFNQSFNHLLNISSIYLQKSMIQENKCIFMHSIERVVKRNVNNGKYKFYKSINLISNGIIIFDEDVCELTLEFLQFKIHWNLKKDIENEFFYEKCKNNLIQTKNNFNHSLRKCFNNFQIIDIGNSDENKEEQKGIIVKLLSNGVFILTLILILLLFVPIFTIVYFQTIKWEYSLSEKVENNLENDLNSEKNLDIDLINPIFDEFVNIKEIDNVKEINIYAEEKQHKEYTKVNEHNEESEMI